MNVEGVENEVAADWYPDPIGRHQYRYWDGASWTQHVADNGKAGLDPTPAAPQSTQERAQDGEPAQPAPATSNEVSARCPYCSGPLDKMPGRKKKCPHCDQYMYVRTRPSDRQRVVVTEAGADEIDSQWQRTRLVETVDSEEFEKAKTTLAAKFGREPSDYDVLWGLYNKHLLQQARNGDWGLYRNTRLAMAVLLAAEGKQRPAFDTYLEVAYLDSNGPNNRGGLSDPVLLNEFPPFTRDSAFVAPGIVSEIIARRETLGLSEADAQTAFLAVASKLQQRMKLPVSPEKAWEDLQSTT